MRKSILVAMMLAILLAPALWADNISGTLDRIQYVDVENAVIDGSDTDPGWAEVLPVTFEAIDQYFDNGGTCGQIIVRFYRNATHLYGHLAVQDASVVIKDWSQWRGGDSIVVGITTQGDDKLILVKPDGVKMSTPPGDVLASFPGEAAFAEKAGGWAVEFSIPFANLGGVPGGTAKMAVAMRDVTPGIPGFSVLGSNQHAVWVLEGKKTWSEVEVKTEPAGLPIVTDPLSLPSGKTGRVIVMDRVVTKVGNGFFCCQRNPRQMGGLKVIWSGIVHEKDIIVEMTGRLDRSGREKVFVADNVVAQRAGFMKLPEPYGMTTSALGPLNFGLIVKSTGRVVSTIAGGFLLDSGRQTVRVEWAGPVLSGQTISVTGISSASGDDNVLLAKEIQGEEQ